MVLEIVLLLLLVLACRARAMSSTMSCCALDLVVGRGSTRAFSPLLQGLKMILVRLRFVGCFSAFRDACKASFVVLCFFFLFFSFFFLFPFFGEGIAGG